MSRPGSCPAWGWGKQGAGHLLAHGGAAGPGAFSISGPPREHLQEGWLVLTICRCSHRFR